MKEFRGKTQHFHTKLLRLRQMEWRVKDGPIIKSAVLLFPIYIFENVIRVQKPLINIWFNIPINQISIFLLFLSAWVIWGCIFPVNIININWNSRTFPDFPGLFFQFSRTFASLITRLFQDFSKNISKSQDFLYLKGINFRENWISRFREFLSNSRNVSFACVTIREI